MGSFTPDYGGTFVDGAAGGTPMTGAVMSNIETQYADAMKDTAALYGSAGTAVYTVAPSYGDGATDATSSIQAQLNAVNSAGGGIVRIPKGASGAYKVTSELTVYSNTVIDARGATISLTGSAGRLLRNAAWGGAALRTVADGAMTAGSTTLTSSTAAFTSADVGRSVSVAGAGASGNQFNSTIASVTNATTAVLTFAASTTVTAASTSLYSRDSNITIHGGMWTRDTTGSSVHLINLNRVDGALIQDVFTVTSNGKYSIVLSNSTRVSVVRPTFNSYSDGVHITGPASQVLIDGPTGVTGDDFIAITARDYAPEAEVNGGDVQNVTIRNVNATQARGNLVHLLAGAGTKLRNILVDGVQGLSTQAGGVALTDDTTSANTTGQDVDGIVVRNVSATIAAAQSQVGIAGAGIKNVLVDGVNVNQSNVNINGVMIGGTATAVGVVIRNLTVNSSANHTIVNVASGAALSTLVIDGGVINLDPAGSNGVFLQLAASPTRLSMENIIQFGGVNFVNASTTATLYAEMSNIVVKSGAANLYLIGAAAAHNVSINNLLIEGPGNGFFVLTAGSLDAQVNNYRAVSGNLLYRSATQTVRINGVTAKCDVSTLTPQDGDMAFNTNSALLCGTGPAVYQGTAGKWKGLYSGATN